MNIKACLTSNSDLWTTPSNMYKWFIDQGWFDPCPVNPTFDGLSIDWEKRNFVNPPYSQIVKWIDKAIQEMDKGNFTIMLIPARTDTKWFRKLVLTNSVNIEFIEGRLKFGDGLKSAPFPSMFVRFGGFSFGLCNKFGYLFKEEIKDTYKI